jgi:hypothetical protein
MRYISFFVFSLFLATCSILGFSQVPPKVAIFAGVNSLRFDINKATHRYSFSPQLNIGIGVNTPLSQHQLFLRNNILFQVKGVTKYLEIEDSEYPKFNSFSTFAYQPELHYQVNTEPFMVTIYIGGQVGVQSTFSTTNFYGYPFLDFAILGGVSLNIVGSAHNGYRLSVAYTNFPYTIEVKNFDEAENRIHWSGLQLHLSYEFNLDL